MRDNKKTLRITISGVPLTLIFVILKLTDIINWSWVWVFSPLWILAIITILGLLLGLLLVAVLGYTVKKVR